jgi:hypothetical protein
MSERKVSVNLSPSPVILLTVLFIALKVSGNIDWSWVWVLAPLWIIPAAILGFIVAIFIFIGVAAILVAIFER